MIHESFHPRLFTLLDRVKRAITDCESGTGPVTEVIIPDGFILGVATSAYQVEGAADRGGRSPSIWDTFSHTPGTVRDDVPGDRGSDHFDRLDEDLAIMRDLGIDSYRFSISWSRLIPDGVGEVNEEGVAFYDRLIDGLLASGIQPNVTLYHWDLPQALQNRGGWANREVVDWFDEYSRVAFARFGDRVRLWATLNEPISLWVGYGLGVFAPGIKDPRQGKQAMHNAMLAHGRAVQNFRAAGSPGQIGIVIDVWKRYLAADTAENRQIADREEDESFRFFFDELFAGGLSDRSLAQLRRDDTLPDIREGDSDLAGQPIDFLGLNVYARVVVDSTADTTAPDLVEQKPGGNYLSNGSELYPDVLLDAVRVARHEYGVTLPIYITENGTPVEGEANDGVVDVVDRVRYVSEFLRRAVRAHDEGLGVQGYYLWSLLDNYEWAAAYTMRFGIVRVDPETFDRSYKSSAHWYRAVNRERRFELE
jgi:beta-glucosidase